MPSGRILAWNAWKPRSLIRKTNCLSNSQIARGFLTSYLVCRQKALSCVFNSELLKPNKLVIRNAFWTHRFGEKVWKHHDWRISSPRCTFRASTHRNSRPTSPGSSLDFQHVNLSIGISSSSPDCLIPVHARSSILIEGDQYFLSEAPDNQNEAWITSISSLLLPGSS